MKNFQQTPKQRRKAKAEMAGFKAKLRASKPGIFDLTSNTAFPCRTSEQVSCGSSAYCLYLAATQLDTL